jgi:hypothetical protein
VAGEKIQRGQKKIQTVTTQKKSHQHHHGIKANTVAPLILYTTKPPYKVTVGLRDLPPCCFALDIFPKLIELEQLSATQLFTTVDSNKHQHFSHPLSSFGVRTCYHL